MSSRNSACLKTDPRRTNHTLFKASVYSKVFWFESQKLLASEQARYHIHGVFDYNKPCNEEKLKSVLSGLMQNNYALRSNFVELNNELFIKVHDVLDFEIPRTPSFNRGDRQRIIKSFLAQPFDLISDQLFAALLIDNLDSAGQTLVIKLHHIIASGNDFQDLMNEIGERYQQDDRSITLDDFQLLEECIEYERQRLNNYQPGYWKNKLANSPKQNLFHGQSSHAIKGPLQQHYFHVILDDDLYRVLRQFCEQQGSSLFNVMKLAWGITLCQYLGRQSILLCYPMCTKHKHPQFKQVKGARINTLFHLHDNHGTATDLLDQMKKERDDIANFFQPTIDITAEANLNASAFNFGITQSTYGLNGPTLESVPVAEMIPCIGASNLTLNCNGQQLRYVHTLGTLVNTNFLETLHTHFLSVLTSIIQRPNADIASLSSVNAPSILFADSYPGQLNSPQQVIHSIVKSDPEAIAIVDDECQVDYQTLWQRSGLIARLIRDAQLPIGSKVGVMLPRSAELIIAMLGLWRAGMVYLPLDPSLPNERLKLIVEDAKVDLIIGKEGSAYLNAWSKLSLVIDQINWDGGSEENFTDHVEIPEAYLIYTSGSTGRPKGVLQTHQTISNLIEWEQQNIDLGRNARISLIAHPGFDVSIEEICYALMSGHSLHVVPDEIKLNPLKLLSFFNSNQINRIFLPTALLDSFCQVANKHNQNNLSHLKNITVAGEALRLTPSIQEFFDSQQQIALFNEYGPTETHVATANKQGWRHALEGMSLIGRPISGTTIYILGEQMQPAPLGMAGEIYIAGAGIANGYLNQSELTRDRFLPNPLYSANDQLKHPHTIYKTGDLGRITDSGEIEYLGRNDSQVQINGYRVEPAEVEKILNNFPGIDQCSIVTQAINGRHRLLACYSSRTQITEMKLREHISQTLPPYMMPWAFVWLQQFPVTTNGKVDKKQLSTMKINFLSRYVSPRCDVEQRLCDLWQNRLTIDQVGINDHFFELGGDSLEALGAVIEMSTIIGDEVSVAELYRYDTIASLIDYLKSRNGGEKRLIIKLNSVISKIKLFLFHTARGSAEVYHHYAQTLDCEVYGVESYNIYSKIGTITNLDYLCRIYTDKIVEHIENNDTILVGGWSFGGLLACKVAEKLSAQFKLNGIVLFDTMHIDIFKQFPVSRDSSWAEKLSRYGHTNHHEFTEKIIHAGELHESMYRTACPTESIDHLPVLLFVADQIDSEYIDYEEIMRLNPEIWAQDHQNLICVDMQASHEMMFSGDSVAYMVEKTNWFLEHQCDKESKMQHASLRSTKID